MKRTVRRILVITAGLVLGWYVAGFAPSLGLGTGTSLAADSATAGEEHGAGPRAADTRGEAHAAPAGEEEHATHEGHGAHDGADPGELAASRIVPTTEAEISWYWSVVMGIVGLFILAIVLGYPALKLQAPPPPEPAPDDHAHDDPHGGGAHAAVGADHADKPAAGHAH